MRKEDIRTGTMCREIDRGGCVMLLLDDMPARFVQRRDWTGHTVEPFHSGRWVGVLFDDGRMTDLLASSLMQEDVVLVTSPAHLSPDAV